MINDYSKHTCLTKTASKNLSSKKTASDNVLSKNAESKQTLPKNMLPKNKAPKNKVLKNTVSRLLKTMPLKRGAQALLLPIAICFSLSACAREANVVLPPPIVSETTKSNHEVIVLSGGCFWGVQGVFQHVKGVTQATSGYVGGSSATARYDAVVNGNTGHAESVKVEFDPAKISLGELLRIYFSVAHDPTELNKQGPDTGTQYRSAIWYSNSAQQKVAQAYINQLSKTNIFPKRIVTQVNPLQKFYPAEVHHQNYLTLHPNNLYIKINDMPKVASLKRLYPADYQVKPVLVGE